MFAGTDSWFVNTLIWLVTPGFGLGITFTIALAFLIERLGVWHMVEPIHRVIAFTVLVVAIAFYVVWASLPASSSAITDIGESIARSAAEPTVWSVVFKDVGSFLQFMGLTAFLWILGFLTHAADPAPAPKKK